MIVVGSAAAVAAILALVGVLAVVKAQRRLEDHLERLDRSQHLILDSARLEGALARFNRAVQEAGPLLVRAARALSQIADGLGALRRVLP